MFQEALDQILDEFKVLDANMAKEDTDSTNTTDSKSGSQAPEEIELEDC